ncbi:MAG TPA: sulfur reduction protein DsrE [Phycisphaerales bacterium]|nr:sulfur reduction protein DsrE [Phycisphaerales bacterium]
MERKKKILYVQTSGVETPERTYAPFILGVTAIAMGMDACIFFGIKGCTIVQRGEADKVKLPQPFGLLKTAIEQATKAGVSFLVCEESARMLGIDLEKGLINGVKIVGAATLNTLVMESDAVMYF